MYPGTHAMWTIWNRWLVDKLKERGDPLEVEREVDHLVRLPSADKARAAGAALTAAGFRVDPLRPPGEQGELWVLEFHRNERCDGRHPNGFVFEVLDAVLPLDGDYDGWATGIPKPPTT
jgi:Regulator of ribonuclease activity B